MFKKADKLYDGLAEMLEDPGTRKPFADHETYMKYNKGLVGPEKLLDEDQFNGLKHFLTDLEARGDEIESMSDNDIEALGILCDMRLEYVNKLAAPAEAPNVAPAGRAESPIDLKPMGDPYKEIKAALSKVNLTERRGKFEAWRQTINDPLYQEADFYKLIPKTSGGGDSSLIVVAKRAHLEEGDNPSEKLHALKRTLMANMTNNKEEYFLAAFEIYLTYSPDGPEVLKLLQNDKVLEDPGLRSMADVATTPRVMVEAQSAMLEIQNVKRDAEIAEKAMTPDKLAKKVVEWKERELALNRMWSWDSKERKENAILEKAIPLAMKVIALLENSQELKTKYDQYLKNVDQEKATDENLVNVLNALDLLGILDEPDEKTLGQLEESAGLIRNIYSSSGLPSID